MNYYKVDKAKAHNYRSTWEVSFHKNKNRQKHKLHRPKYSSVDHSLGCIHSSPRLYLTRTERSFRFASGARLVGWATTVVSGAVFGKLSSFFVCFSYHFSSFFWVLLPFSSGFFVTFFEYKFIFFNTRCAIFLYCVTFCWCT